MTSIQENPSRKYETLGLATVATAGAVGGCVKQIRNGDHFVKSIAKSSGKGALKALGYGFTTLVIIDIIKDIANHFKQKQAK